MSYSDLSLSLREKYMFLLQYAVDTDLLGV